MIQAALVEKLETYKKQSDYSRLANLLTHSLTANSKEINQATFGYIPRLFREIRIDDPAQGIQPADIFVGEPVIYRLMFPDQLTMGGISFFYLFCYLKPDSKKLNVYFQSAARSSIPLSQKNYSLEQNKIKFEGINAAFQEQHSAICISDPGHFLPNLTSSFYVGTDKLNFTRLIAFVIESICRSSQISLHNTLLFGSAAGAMGALLTSTYFSQKVQVLY